MNYRIALVFLLWAMPQAFHIQAQSQVKDVPGWRAATWGMTEDQVLQAFKGEATRFDTSPQANKPHMVIGIPRLDVEGITLRVIFAFDEKTKRLEEVLMQPIVEPTASREYFQRLEPLLVAKYGQPSYKTSDAESHQQTGVFKKVKWTVPSTDIQLDYSESSIPEMRKFDSCSISYKAHHDNKL